MKAPLGLLVIVAAAVVLPGCMFVPKTDLNAALTENRSLAEQNRVQLAEIENLQTHNHALEDRVIHGEKQLAVAQEQAGVDHRQLDDYQHERDELYRQFKELSYGGGRLPPEVGRQLTDLSRRYPSLQFDPATGISKLDADILFDSGDAELKPAAGDLIDELVRILKAPEAGELKLMVAGHTDNQAIVGRDTRERFPDNFHLSTARALAVAERMKRAGLPEQRLGVAGFGPYQPIASNATAVDRQKNRRVEIFVMPSDVPVVGWSDSTPSVYSRGVRR